MSEWKNKELEKDWKRSWAIITFGVAFIIGMLGALIKNRIIVFGICQFIWALGNIVLLENYQCRRSIDNLKKKS